MSLVQLQLSRNYIITTVPKTSRYCLSTLPVR